jgi:putative transposase
MRLSRCRHAFAGSLWTNMTRLRGWAPRDQGLADKVLSARWKTATFLAGLRNDRIEGPCLFDGPSTANASTPMSNRFLVPILKPRDVVILDSLGSHKRKAVRRTIGCLIILPKYSPGLNPIEQAFAKFKTLLQKAGARSYEAVWQDPRPILARRMRRRH